MTLKLFSVSHTDDDGDCMDQMVFAENEGQAVDLWLTRGIMEGRDCTSRQDPTGPVVVFPVPTQADESKPLDWDHANFKRFALDFA